jgi:RNA polymerase sigma-70 factor, ECF subfamily
VTPTLIARWRAGDERAASLLVQRHAGALTRFLASLGERDEVEEIVQHAFVRAFGSPEGFRSDSSLRTWLFAIARHLIVDRTRGRRTARRLVSNEVEHAASEHDALDLAVADETEERLAAR